MGNFIGSVRFRWHRFCVVDRDGRWRSSFLRDLLIVNLVAISFQWINRQISRNIWYRYAFGYWIYIYIYSFLWCCGPTRAMASFLKFLYHTQRHTTVGWTPLDERSARRRDVYLTTHNSQQTTMPSAEFEPIIPAGERPQIYAVDRTFTGTGWHMGMSYFMCRINVVAI
jgi:hypothetical protein